MHRLGLFLWLLIGSVSAGAGLRPTHLLCEQREQPLGIDSTEPRLSWTLDSTDPAARELRQSAYQIVVATTRAKLAPANADLWDSGKISSDQMAQIVYAGKPLQSDQPCAWAVRVWDQEGHPSNWSSPSSWTMGLLAASDCQGSCAGMRLG